MDADTVAVTRMLFDSLRLAPTPSRFGGFCCTAANRESVLFFRDPKLLDFGGTLLLATYSEAVLSGTIPTHGSESSAPLGPHAQGGCSTPNRTPAIAQEAEGLRRNPNRGRSGHCCGGCFSGTERPEGGCRLRGRNRLFLSWA